MCISSDNSIAFYHSLTFLSLSKDQYGLHSDQFPGHPDGVNCIIPVTDNVVMTGCEDGNIRAVHLYPHRFLGVVGHHEQEFPVERLDVNTSGEIIASISHDNRSVDDIVTLKSVSQLLIYQQNSVSAGNKIAARAVSSSSSSWLTCLAGVVVADNPL